jgi:predicted neuraminidase
VLITRDGGNTWRDVDVPESLGLVHMSIVPSDGDSLIAFFRSRWADHVYRCESHDRGDSWTVPEALDVPNNNSSTQVTRSRRPGSRRLLMVLNPVAAPPGSADGDIPADIEVDTTVPVIPGDAASGVAQPLARHAVWGTARCPLSLYASDDDGRTWSHVLDLENEATLAGDGSRSWRRNPPEMSYPTVTTDVAGNAHITYSYDRQAIKYVRVPVDLIDRS